MVITSTPWLISASVAAASLAESDQLKGPAHDGFSFRVDGLRTQFKGIDKGDRPANREGADEAQLVGFGHQPRCRAHNVEGLRGFAKQVGKIIGHHVAANVLKYNVRVLLGQVKGWLLVTKAGREDQRGALIDHGLHGLLSIRAFRNILSFDDIDAGNILLYFHDAFMHGLVITCILDRTHIERANGQARSFFLGRLRGFRRCFGRCIRWGNRRHIGGLRVGSAARVAVATG